MKFDKAVEQVREELLKKYREVIFERYQSVKMTSNTTTSKYGHQTTTIDIENIKVRHIKDRFKEITGEITAVEAVFEVKYPRKRNSSYHTEYFEIINQ